MKLSKFSAHIDWTEHRVSVCLWQQGEDSYLVPEFSGKTVLQTDLQWKSAAIGESAAGAGLAQCVGNHPTPNPSAFGMRSSVPFSHTAPQPLLCCGSLPSWWQIFGKISSLPSPASSPLLWGSRSPGWGFWGHPCGDIVSCESLLFSASMTERNVTRGCVCSCHSLFFCLGYTNLPTMVVWVMLFFSPSSPHICLDVPLFSNF